MSVGRGCGRPHTTTSRRRVSALGERVLAPGDARLLLPRHRQHVPAFHGCSVNAGTTEEKKSTMFRSTTLIAQGRFLQWGALGSLSREVL